VVKTRANLRPWRLAAAFGAYAVLEVPAGTLARVNLTRGDMLTVVPGS
jgi:uncharacterized membrane protein (UPF0127 family)